MTLNHFDRIVILAVDLRWPDFSDRTATALVEHGATCGIHQYLNGRGRDGIDAAHYNLVHRDEPPASWTAAHSRNLWDYWSAYRAVISKALADGVDKLLVCEDDLEFSPNFRAVTARASVPDDWQLVYLGAMHRWASEPARPVAPYVVRLNGGQVGIQAVGWRREAMRRFLELPIDRPTDWAVAGMHGEFPSYCLEPSVIRQAQGVASVNTPGEKPFEAGFLYKLKG